MSCPKCQSFFVAVYVLYLHIHANLSPPSFISKELVQDFLETSDKFVFIITLKWQGHLRSCK